MARPALPAHTRPHAHFSVEQTPRQRFRGSPHCGSRPNPPLPAPCCPPGLSEDAILRCLASRRMKVVPIPNIVWSCCLACSGFHPPPAEGRTRTGVSCLLTATTASVLSSQRALRLSAPASFPPTTIPAASLLHCQSPAMACRSSAKWLAEPF